MKEAAGEANMTVITIVLIGVVAAVGAILIPRLMNAASNKSCCQELGGYVSGNKCMNVNTNGEFVSGQSIVVKSVSGLCD